MDQLLVGQGLHRSFGGVDAVRGVDIAVSAGSITGLMGPNGAGKSTLVDILAGAQRPDTGKVLLGGADVTRLRPYARARRGLIRTFQRTSEFGHMTVLENLLTGTYRPPIEGIRGAVIGRRMWGAQMEADVTRARDLLEQFNLLGYVDTYAETLSGGERRILELLRAVMANPTVLILDEPMAGVSPAVAGRVVKLIADLRDSGVAVLLIEHEVEFIEELCRPIFVMAAGKIIAEGTSLDEVRTKREVLDAYAAG